MIYGAKGSVMLWYEKYTKKELELWGQGKLFLKIPCITCGKKFMSEGTSI